MKLNLRAAECAGDVIRGADDLRVAVRSEPGGPTLIDAGVEAAGGLEAGLALVRTCMSGLGRVSLAADPEGLGTGIQVAVHTDHPVPACMASQYAGWKISGGSYFAMGSGPMRAAAGRESLFDKIGHREQPGLAVGVLEAGSLPPPEICRKIAADCGVPLDRLTLLVARTASQAGTMQIVARSVETCLHKLFELGFDLSAVQSGWGTAPLPPVAADDLTAIGRTNDAILYGGRVTLWVRGADEAVKALGPKTPSRASAAHGEPFLSLFQRAGGDFYKLDPMLFSPAMVTFQSLDTGCTYTFGELRADVVERSFGS